MRDYKSFIGYKGEDANKIKEDLRDGQGRPLTESLFLETISKRSSEKGYTPFYSLKDYENGGLPSAYHIYINSVDESEAALKLVGCYSHWRRLCSLSWFINGRSEAGFEGISKWRLDMAERDKTKAKEVLITQMEAGNVTASRTLYKLAQEDEKLAHKVVPRKSNKKVTKDDSNIMEFLRQHKET